MKRDWDKLKRQDRARSSYDPIASFKPAKRKKRFKKHKAKSISLNSPSLKPKPVSARNSLPEIERILTIHPGKYNPWLSRWRRTKGKWKCIQADEPIGWFTRVIHVNVVGQWLLDAHVDFKWQPATPVCRAHNQHTEDKTAEAYPPSQASAPSGVNTVASLNNPSPVPVCASRTATEPGLEQDGVASPHCLIGADRTAQPETSVNRS